MTKIEGRRWMRLPYALGFVVALTATAAHSEDNAFPLEKAKQVAASYIGRGGNYKRIEFVGYQQERADKVSLFINPIEDSGNYVKETVEFPFLELMTESGKKKWFLSFRGRPFTPVD